MTFADLFPSIKPVIACIHLLPLPGAPLYDGNLHAVYDMALQELEIFNRWGVQGVIVENFRDKPFYPDRIPVETVAALTALTREVTRTTSVPVGVNALRSDGESAMAIATAADAQFIRVNVHAGVIVSEQGLVFGSSHHTMRLRSALRSSVLVFADVGVKHAAPLVDRGLATEARDTTDRALADALIVSGELTSVETKPEDVDVVRHNTRLPILIGSGATVDNIDSVYSKVDGFIVGSYFKKDGVPANDVDPERVQRFMTAIHGHYS